MSIPWLSSIPCTEEAGRSSWWGELVGQRIPCSHWGLDICGSPAMSVPAGLNLLPSWIFDHMALQFDTVWYFRGPLVRRSCKEILKCQGWVLGALTAGIIEIRDRQNWLDHLDHTRIPEGTTHGDCGAWAELAGGISHCACLYYATNSWQPSRQKTVWLSGAVSKVCQSQDLFLLGLLLAG